MMDDELGRLSRNLLGGTEENGDNFFALAELASGLRFGLEIF
jgi:hypothetical protein